MNNNLTARESEVMHLMAQGYSNTAIASRMIIERKTVERHVWSIFSKYGITPNPAVSPRVTAVLRYKGDTVQTVETVGTINARFAQWQRKIATI